MKFGIRLILAGLAALIAGGLFISESFEKPIEGMEPTPIWKGGLAVVLGLGLLAFGIKYMIDENREPPAGGGDDADA